VPEAGFQGLKMISFGDVAHGCATL
jgi:hypothetical protein